MPSHHCPLPTSAVAGAMALDVFFVCGLMVAFGVVPAQAKTKNPFLGQRFYINPMNRKEYDASIATASGKVKANLRTMSRVPSAYWIDVKEKVRGNGTGCVEGILRDAAAASPAELVVFIWYNLPNRDCGAKASAGQICCTKNGDGTCNYDALGYCGEGIEEYKSEYVDPFVEALKHYQDQVPVVVVIEPDSLANLATNLKDPHCGNSATQAAYKIGIKYALDQLAAQAPNVSVYLDAAHGGWLGWEDSIKDFMTTLKYMDLPLSHIRGFATNVANYQPLGTECPWCPDQGYRNGFCLQGKHAGHPCCDDPCGLLAQWNPGNNELNYAKALVAAAGGMLGMDAHVIIDTGRNGVGDHRKSCANWCNPRGAGAGVPSTTNVTNSSLVDAYFWLKTPGESDGCSPTLPNGTACPRFDSMCSSEDSLGTTEPEAVAPEAGRWYDYQVKMLAANARFEPEAHEAGSVCPSSANFFAAPAPAPTTAPPSATARPSSTTSSTKATRFIPCAGVFQQCGQVRYDATKRVVMDEGMSLAHHIDRYYSLKECKSLCNAMPACNSFAYLPGECHLKDKCVHPSDPIVAATRKYKSRYRTYFKGCGIRNSSDPWTGATCCEAGCTCESQGGYFSQCMPPNGTSECKVVVKPLQTTTTLSVTTRNASAPGSWFFAPASSSKRKPAPATTTRPQFLQLPSALPPPEACAEAYQQCGGDEDWRGPDCCNAGCTCETRGAAYRQCIPPNGESKCRAGQVPHIDFIIRKYFLRAVQGTGPTFWRMAALFRAKGQAAAIALLLIAVVSVAGLGLRSRLQLDDLDIRRHFLPRPSYRQMPACTLEAETV